MIVRPALVVVHRWSGLAIALVVTVAGLTGSILAFRATVDGWFAPAFYATPLPERGRWTPSHCGSGRWPSCPACVSTGST